MAKKYLSFEETAEKLGIKTEELTRLREAGELRGFADRGTWKFRTDDVEEFSRTRQADSDPDVPLYSEEPSSDDSSSALAGDEDQLSEQPTEIRRDEPAPGAESKMQEGASDSDVRLVLDDSLKSPSGEEASDAASSMEDSDSDVQLTDENDQLVDTGQESDSDVKMVDPAAESSDSDSDVKLAPDSESEGDSDSDVQLVGQDKEQSADSDSDVKLAPQPDAEEPGSDSDVQLISQEKSAEAGTGSDSDVGVVSGAGPESGEGSSIVGDKRSETPAESGRGAALGADDSGISLEAEEDSGISLEPGEDSGITVGEESDMLAEAGSDDSAALADDSSQSFKDDSGISLQGPVDSGIALDAGSSDDELSGGIPLLDQDVDSDDETQLEVPALEEGASGESDETDTEVVFFDDQESGDETATAAKESGGTETPSEPFAEVDEFSAEFADDDLEVAADVLGEDEELEEVDVFDAGDEDFDESFETGESHAEFAAPMARAGVAPGVEEEWGAPVLAGLTISTLLMAVCGMVLFDLVRSMWGWQQPFAVNSALLDQLRGLFGS